MLIGYDAVALAQAPQQLTETDQAKETVAEAAVSFFVRPSETRLSSTVFEHGRGIGVELRPHTAPVHRADEVRPGYSKYV